MVAPRRGAWIETLSCNQKIKEVKVAPRRGAWIETCCTDYVALGSLLVAPRRGAWIETDRRYKFKWKAVSSHPAGVRGLKLRTRSRSACTSLSHPAGVRGLKQPTEPRGPQAQRVAPRRGAWIETGTATVTSLMVMPSHPAGVRGLKPPRVEKRDKKREVAPRRGAWIETSLCTTSNPASPQSHPAGVRGLKRYRRNTLGGGRSRTPQGCVD